MSLRVETRKLESAREKMGISKYRFAMMLGITMQTYNSILYKKSTSLKRLASIGRILKINPKDLLTTD